MNTNIAEIKRILLVEDDVELAQLIQEYLQTMEFSVEVEPNGAEVNQRVLNESPDLIILDLMLPGKDGISICREVRDHFDGGIIMLTASGESVDHVLGLELGADDFLTKPIEPRVLLAHVRAVLRRYEEFTNDTLEDCDSFYRITNLNIHFDSRKVTVNNSNIDLTGPEYELLCLLVKNQGVVLSRDDILNQLRGIEYDGQNRLIDVTISQLRSKLSIDGFSHRHIKTVRSKGYLFAEKP